MRRARKRLSTCVPTTDFLLWQGDYSRNKCASPASNEKKKKMILPVLLNETSTPKAPNGNGWYLLDGDTLRDVGPFESEYQASLWVDQEEPPLRSETLVAP